MTKKLILLTLALPMVLMITLFSATKAASYSIGVSVSSVEIIAEAENRIVYLDLDSNENYKLDYAVYPTNAANKEITISYEPLEGEPLADIEHFKLEDENSYYITPKSTGAARLYITSADGGYRDSILVYVESNTLKSITSWLEAVKIREDNGEFAGLYVGESCSISTEFSPKTPSNTILHYESSNPSVLTVDNKGVVKALRKGSATITVRADADANIFDTIDVSVANVGALDIAEEKVSLSGNSGSVALSLDVNPGDDYELSAIAYDQSGLISPALTVSIDEASGLPVLKYNFTDESFTGTVTVKVTLTTVTGTVIKECEITKVRDITAEFNEDLYAFTIGNREVFFTVTPSDVDVSYQVTASNSNILPNMVGSRLMLNCLKEGVTTVKLTITNESNPEQDPVVIETTVLVKPSNVIISESVKEYGIEKVLTIGKYNPDGSLFDFSLHYNKTDKQGVGFDNCIRWESSAPDKVSIDNQGKLKFENGTFNEIITFTAKFVYGNNTVVSEKFKVRCVSDGVNLSTYKDLIAVTEAGKPIILTGNITDDFGYIDGVFNPKIYEITTTYDKTYYDNVNEDRLAEGKGKIPDTVKILVNFKNNLYGNGYIINSDNVSGDPNYTYFKGPLNFVAASDTQTGGAISVKGQDNISFALYEGVTVNNVQFQSYNFGNANEFDLADLTNIGTTVEIFGDRVNIEYSRISNGRTCLRIFGDINDPEKIINVSIKNSLLSRAREFIIRMGSNCFINGDSYLEGDSSASNNFNNKLNYSQMSPEEQKAHDDAFIKTFVTVENCIFEHAGIFAIGIDSHFAGDLLADGENNAIFSKYLDNWHDLAKTSYGAKLTLAGDVKFYNWNEVDNINSDTLIDISDNAPDLFKNLVLDIKAMIRAAATKKEDNKNIISSYEGKDYVHAGIAFFGGGKNYGVVDMESYASSDNCTLNGYQISLTDAERSELEMAAGTEPFYFLLADKTGAYTPEAQKNILAGSNAYDCINPKNP